MSASIHRLDGDTEQYVKRQALLYDALGIQPDAEGNAIFVPDWGRNYSRRSGLNDA